MNRQPLYPTPERRRIAEALAGLLSSRPDVWAVALHGSLARGGATASSDIDLSAMVEPGALARVRAEARPPGTGPSAPRCGVGSCVLAPCGPTWGKHVPSI